MKAIASLCLALILGTSAFSQAKKEEPKRKVLELSKLKIDDEGIIRDSKFNALRAFVVDEVVNENTVVAGLGETRTLRFVFKMDTKNLADGSVFEPSGVWKVTGKEKRGTSTLFVLEKIAKK